MSSGCAHCSGSLLACNMGSPAASSNLNVVVHADWPWSDSSVHGEVESRRLLYILI